MEKHEILKYVNRKRLHGWLSSVLLPMLMEANYFEDMGFPAWFVRQFVKKHDRVVGIDRVIRRGVRGVNELDFLQGLASALGVDPPKGNLSARDARNVARIAGGCLAAIAALDEDQERVDHAGDMLPGDAAEVACASEVQPFSR